MPNVTISDLPLATLPLDGPNSFFEVQTLEGGVQVSRRVAADNITIVPDLPDASEVGQILYAASLPDSYLATSAVLVDPSGAVTLQHNAINTARTLAAGSGGFEVNNTLTGGGFERVLTTSDGSGLVDSVNSGTNITVDNTDAANPIVNLNAAITGTSVNGVTLTTGGAATNFLNETGAYSVPAGATTLGSLTDVTLTAEATGDMFFKSAGDWINTSQLSFTPGASPGASTFLDLSDGDSEVGRIVKSGSGEFRFRNTEIGQSTLLEVTIAGPTVHTGVSVAAGGAVQLFHNNVSKVSTTAEGADVLGSLLDVDNSGNDALTSSLVRNSQGGIRTQVAATTGQMSALQTSNAGVDEDTLWEWSRNGEFGFRRNNVQLVTSFDAGGTTPNNIVGLSVLGISGDNNPAYILRDNLGNVRAQFIWFDANGTNGDVFVENQDTGNDLHLRVRGIGGTQETGVTVVADGEVSLRHNNIIAAQTNTVQPVQDGGSFTVDDGDEFHPVQPVRHFEKTADTARTSTTMSADPHMTASLAAGIYIVEIFMMCQCTDTVGDIKVGLSWSGTANDQRAVQWTGPELGIATSDSTAGLVGTQVALAGAPGGLAFGVTNSGTVSTLIHGWCIFDATTGPSTLAVHWARNGASGTTTVFTNSRMIVSRVGDT